MFPDRFHRVSARAHPGRAPKDDARMATLPWPRVRIWAAGRAERVFAALKVQLAAAAAPKAGSAG